MDKQEDYFLPNHDRLLNIAWWSKHMAWIVLVAYILWVGIQVIQLVLAKDEGNFFGSTSQGLATMLGVVVSIAVTYFPLKALAHILRILMEMEFRSRKAN